MNIYNSISVLILLVICLLGSYPSSSYPDSNIYRWMLHTFFNGESSLITSTSSNNFTGSPLISGSNLILTSLFLKCTCFSWFHKFSLSTPCLVSNGLYLSISACSLTIVTMRTFSFAVLDICYNVSLSLHDYNLNVAN